MKQGHTTARVFWKGALAAEMRVVNEDDWIERHWARSGRFYEPNVLEVIEAEARNGANRGTFVDIGAHRGNHTIFALNVCGFSKVVAFEPNPESYHALMRNLYFNKVNPDRYRAQMIGLTDRDSFGVAQFGFPMNPHLNTGQFRITGQSRIADDLPDACPTISVPVAPYTSIPAFLTNLPKPTLFKVDVEGLEQHIVPWILTWFQCPVISGNPVKFHPDMEVNRISLGLEHWLYKPTTAAAPPPG